MAGFHDYFRKIRSNSLLSIALVCSIFLIISIFFIYRTFSWPTGLEASGCLISAVLMVAGLLMLWILRDKVINDLQKRNVALGLGFGLLWTIEIIVNNIIQPAVTLRDNIDNMFWAIIALLILITAVRDAYRTNKILEGVMSGFWTGISSGAVACLTALIFVVFGMNFLLSDPVNIKEWTDIKATENTPGMDVYFAYQTFAGAVMHLFILGAIMGLFLGITGGLMGKTLHSFKK